MARVTTYTCDHCKGKLDPLDNGLPVALFYDDGAFHMQWTLRSMSVNNELCRDCFIQAIRTGLEAYERGTDLTPEWAYRMWENSG